MKSSDPAGRLSTTQLATRSVRIGASLLVALLTLIALASLPRLTFEDDFRRLLGIEEAEHGSAAAARENACLVLVESPKLLTPAGITALEGLVGQLKALDGVDYVASFLDFRSRAHIAPRSTPPAAGDPLRAAGLDPGNQLLRRLFLPGDHCATLLIVQLRERDRAGTTQLVSKIQRAVSASLRGIPAESYVTGLPALRVAVARAMKEDLLLFDGAGVAVALGLALAFFRSPRAALALVAGPALGALWTLGAMGLVGEALNIVNGMVAPLLLTIGVADSVHLMYYYRKCVDQGASPGRAASTALWRVGPACLYTTLTTAVGFATLGVAEVPAIRHFGWACAGGVVLTLVAVLTAMPLSCLALKPNFGHWRVASPADADFESRPAGRLLGVVIRRAGLISIAGVVLTAALLAIGLRLRPEIRLSGALPSSGEAVEALHEAEDHFGGVLPVTVVLAWPEDRPPSTDRLLAAVEAVERAMEGHEVLGPPVSLRQLLTSLPMNEALAMRLLPLLPSAQIGRFYDAGSRRAYVTCLTEDAGTMRIAPALRAIRAELDRLDSEDFPEFSFAIEATTVGAAEVGHRVIRDLVFSLMLAVPIISLILAVLLRSARLGLISLLPNLFPLAAVAACMVIVGLNLQLVSAALFSIFFGIAVDDTIHLLLAYRCTLHETGEPERALSEAYRRVGPAVIATTVVLVGGVSVVMLSRIASLRVFGLLFVLGLGFALVGDLVLLPALLAWTARRGSPREHRESEPQDGVTGGKLR